MTRDDAPRPDPLPIEPAGRIDATVALPGSKSVTNRALVCAALADGASTLRGWLDADDTRAMIGALQRLGVAVARSDDGALVVGAGRPVAGEVGVDARQSGTTSRFLLPLLGLADQPRRLDGDEQLRTRPMGPAFDALRALGATVTEEGRPGFLPAVVHGPMKGGTVEVAGDVSSQFLSGLLLAGPRLPEGLRVRVATELVSRPYVEMTVAVMRAFGAEVSDEGAQGWAVAPGGYRATDYVVEPDASAASYAWAAGVVTGGAVTVTGLHRGSLQGDVGFADVLEQMGAVVRWDDDAVTVAAGEHLRGIDVDLVDLSDTVPTLVAVAALADGPTTVRGVGFIRHKETDRIAAPVAELRRLGIDAEATDDGLRVTPGPVEPAVVETYRDHRMAMAFALIGLRCEGVRIADPGCVDKTFPGYWALLDELRAGTGEPARP